MQTRLPEIVSRPVFALLVLLLVVLAPCASGDEAEDQYRVAAGHYARGRWELAAEEFGTFLARFPSHPKADQSVFFTAEARLQQRRADEAAERFAEYLRRTPEGPYARVARFRLGEAAYLAGRLDQARLDLEAFYREYPDDPLDAFVLPYLGEIELAQDAAAKAADHFRLALKRFPDSKMNQRCRLGLARSLQGLDQPDEALRLYEALAAEGLGPLSAEARFRLGALEYAQGAYRDAIATLRQLDEALDASRWQPRARLVRAMGLRKLKQFDEAAALLEGLSTDPTVGVEAQYWLAAVRKDQQQWDAAAAILLTTAQKNPNHPLIPAIRFHAGHALLRAKRIAEATEQFDRVLAIDQEDNAWLDDAAMGKIQLAIQQQDPGAVDRQARQFLECFSDSPLADDVRRTWARSLLARAECGQAVDVLRPLVERDDHKPGSLETSYLLALAYRGNGQTREALDCLAPVVSAAKTTSSPWAEACLLHAALSIELGQFDDAVDPLETLLEADPPGDLAAQARAQLAVSLAKSEKWKSAAAQFDTLAAGHPAHPILPPTAEQLAEIAYAAGDWPRAAKQFTWLVDHAEQEPYVNRGLSGLGWTRFRQGQYDQAAATFQRLLDRKPEPRLAAHAARACGHVLEQLGRLEAALAVYQRAIDEYPTSREQADVMLAAARLHGRLGHHDQAATLYESTAKDFPASDQLDTILYEWSWMLTDAQRSDEATALWERLHKDFPESRYWADATYRLAQRAATAGDRATARRLADEVLDAKKAPAEIQQYALTLKCQVNAADEHWDQVRKAAERLLTDHPESSFRRVAEFWVAESLYHQADYDAAATRLDALTDRAHEPDETWLAMVPLRRAQIFAMRKQWTEAFDQASTIERDYPGFDRQYEVDYLLGRCLAARAQFDQARQAYRRAIDSPHGAKTETAAMAQWMIGETYFHQKHYEAALREYLRVEILYDFPRWQAAALLQAGKCHERLSRNDEAARLYRSLVKTYPDSPLVEKAKKRLAATAGSNGASEARRPTAPRR